MGKNDEAERVKREIAEARGDLGETLGELGDRVNGVRDSVADKVSPKRAVRRGADKVRGRVRKVKGSAGDPAEPGTDGRARRVTGRAAAAPRAVAQKAGSNPVAAGLVAFGGGVLLASLFKPTDRERQAARQVKAKVEPLKGKALDAGRTMADDLQQKATQAGVEQVKQRAVAALKQVKEDAQASAGQVRSEAGGAGPGVKPRARAAPRGAAREAKRPSTATKARAEGTAATRRSAGGRSTGAPASPARRRSRASA